MKLVLQATAIFCSPVFLTIFQGTYLIKHTDACSNNPNFRINDDPDKPCNWLRYGTNNKRRERYCTSLEVNQACPQSCGVCCEDDPLYEFKIKSKEMKDCEWLSKKPERQAKWCGDSDRNDGFKTYQGGRMIRDACPVACDMCYDEADAIEAATFKLTTLNPSTFNPTNIPFCFDTYHGEDESPIDDSSFTSLTLYVKDELDLYGTSLLETSTFTFDSSGFCSVGLDTFDGLMGIMIEGTHATSGRRYTFSTSVWAGSGAATLYLEQEDGSAFTDEVTITATSSDDASVKSIVRATDGTGVVEVGPLPERTILFSAFATEGGEHGLSAIAIGSQLEKAITLTGFNEPSDFDNRDFSKGLEGWVIPSWMTNVSMYVNIVEHDEDVGPISVVAGSMTRTASDEAKHIFDIIYKDRPSGNGGDHDLYYKYMHHSSHYRDDLPFTGRGSRRLGQGSGRNLLQPTSVFKKREVSEQLPNDDDATSRSTTDFDIELSTNGIYDDAVRLSSQTFPVYAGVVGVKIRYRFITEEVPNGFYGSRWNDYFGITVRVVSTGQVHNIHKSMNQFMLNEFDYATGSTGWIEDTVVLDMDIDGDSIQLDLVVANVNDNLFDSKIQIDFVHDLVPDMEPFRHLDRLKVMVDKYCDNPEGWKNTDFFDYWGPIEYWDVSQMDALNGVFQNQDDCNPDISRWDVSNIRDFGSMFVRASSFNQDLSAWDVSAGTNFSFMFWSAQSFNQDISAWEVNSATSFQKMFVSASSFDQDLCRWQDIAPNADTLMICDSGKCGSCFD